MKRLHRRPTYAPAGYPTPRAEISPFLGSYLSGSHPGTGFRAPATFEGAIGLVQGPLGNAYDGDGSNNIAYAFTPRPFVLGTDTEFTLVTVFRRPGGGTDTGCIGGMGATGGGSGNTLFRLIGGAVTAGAIQFQSQDSSGSLQYNTESANAGVNDDLWHCAVTALSTATGGSLQYYIDGVARGSVARGPAPAATTFNSVDACGSRRGGSTISASNFDVALVVPLVGVKMSAEWCLRTSRLSDVWGQLFEPRRVWVPVGAAGGAENLTIAEASHGHTADNLSLTSSSHLSVSDASHAHSADNLGLSSASHLTVADATHGHTAENLTLDTSATLSVADATHAHAADALTLTSASHLAVADATHAHSADNVDINAGANLVVQDATHSHSADVLALTSQSILFINDATHAHTADQVAWVTDQPRRGGGRNYIIKGRKYYNLTNEELAYLIGRDLIDVQRADVKVQYTNKRKTIPKNAWAEVEQTLARLNRLVDDEEAAMLLL